MQMTARYRIRQGIGIVRAPGRLIGGPETKQVHEDVVMLLEAGVDRILLDFSRAQWMNSSGLGMLMASYSSVQKVEGRIGLVRVPERLYEVMKITQVHKLFDVYPSIQKALSRMRSM